AGSQRRDFSGFEGLVRLRPDVTLAQAQQVVDDIGRRLAVEYAVTNEGRGFRLARLHDEVVGRMRQPLLLGGLAALLTLAIALANLVTLATVRLSERQAELAVRHALGAGILRVRRQLLTEYTVLVVFGTVVGVGLARWLVAQLLASPAAHLPRPDAIRFDAPVAAAVASVGLLFVLVLTLLPLHTEGLQNAIRKASRVGGGNLRLRRAMIATQVSLALTLSSGGALLGLGLYRLSALNPGFTTEGVSVARASAYATAYSERADVERFVTRVLDELGRLPEVQVAAAGSSVPLSGQASTTSIMAEGQPLPPAARPSAGWEFVTPGYFESLGIAVRRGRAFSASDRSRATHVTIVNEALARSLFPNQNALGKRIAVGGGDSEEDWHEIVGVVDDVRHYDLARPPQPRVYDLFGQHWGRTLYLVTRAAPGRPPLLATSLRRAVASVDSQAPVFEATTLGDLVRRSSAPHRLTTAVASGLAFTGLLLALAGVYAMTASAATQRRREMGVRIALGASPDTVFWLMVRESTATVAVGGAAGVAGAVGAAQLLQSYAFGVGGADVALVVPIVACLLIGAGVAAAVPPARTAAAASPLEAMRTD
ncbi:MAG TPA: FtsX-like permease family protein, partial [Vicinamibacterales bacterium]|nr:FtsX-like permease family protein [Vicinamibacterales bacterium]